MKRINFDYFFIFMPFVVILVLLSCTVEPDIDIDTDIDDQETIKPMEPTEPNDGLENTGDNGNELSIENIVFLDMASRVANFIDEQGTVPLKIYKNADKTESVNAAEFYYMMARWLGWFGIKGETSTPPDYIKIVKGIDSPETPSGIESGTIKKKDVLAKSQICSEYISANNRLPDFITIGEVRYTPQAFFYVMARTIRWYSQKNKIFPNYTTAHSVMAPSSWTNTSPGQVYYSWSRTLSVSFAKQPDSYTCGPTSLMMCMGYYKIQHTVNTISDYMASIGDSPYYDGVAPSIIVDAAKHYGFNGTVMQNGWGGLKNAIAEGHPVIANIQISANNYPCYLEGEAVYTSYSGGHYVVVTGLKADVDGLVEYVVVNDPSKGENLKLTTNSFDTSWVNNKNRLMIRLK